MKEDILEQIAEDFYSKKTGYFAKHNLKFRPSEGHKDYNSKNDSVHSDIDLIIVNTKDRYKIITVSCKSWQGGFPVKRFQTAIENAVKNPPEKEKRKKNDWGHFRELCIDKWTESFLSVLREELNVTKNEGIKLEYVILCTKITDGSDEDVTSFENSRVIKNYFKDKYIDLTIKVKTIKDIMPEIMKKIKDKNTTSVENTHLSRTLQLIRAAGLEIRESHRRNV